MTEKNLEELFIEAAEADSAEVINELTSKVAELEDLSSGDVPDHIALLLESWEESIEQSEAKAQCCIALAAGGAPDSALFRNALSSAVKKILPPYLTRTAFLRALGLRDKETPLPEIASRCKVLAKLKEGVLVYQPDSRGWGKVSKIDNFTASVGISSVTGMSSFATPLEKVLSMAVVFQSKPELLRLAQPNRNSLPPSETWRQQLKSFAVTDLPDKMLESIAFSTLVPAVMSNNDFGKWWKMSSKGSESKARRQPADSRSIEELHVLLSEASEPETPKLDNPEDVAKFARFFGGLNRKLSVKEVKQLVEITAMFSTRASDDELIEIFEPLKPNAPFWPVNPDSAPLENLEVWAKVSAKELPPFTRVTRLLFSEKYLADIAEHLPLRCLNTVCESIDDELITEAILNARHCGSDILLWVWRNRKKHSEKLVSVVDLEHVIAALSMAGMPKAWGAAQRELKKLLMEHKEFQQLVVKNSGESANVFYALLNARSLHPGELKSLIVMLQRHCEKLAAEWKKGNWEIKFFGQASQKPKGPVLPDPPVTSIKSHRIRQQELKDIINKHQPENRKALAAARAHGDFRENAEYDAAKERRNFLSKRRSELESELDYIQPLDFHAVEINDSVVAGCTVTLEFAPGDSREYFIVGAWDGDYDKRLISYNSRFGVRLFGRKTGDEVTLPDGKECKITRIAGLPDDLRKELADEK